MGSENDQFQSVCRTCLSEKEDMKSIFNFSEIIMTCSSIQIEQDDGLPVVICSECVFLANQAYEFRILCEQSDNVLRKKCIKQIVLIKSHRFEANAPELYQDNLCLPEDISTEDKKNVPLQIETNKQDVNKHKDISFEEEFTKTFKTGEFSTKLHYYDENIPNASPLKNEYSNDSDGSDSDDSNDDNSEENDPQTGELSCRYCDMKFRYRVRLKKHEQKHKHGLKCHICEKDFPTIKQLTNHINIHSRKGAHLCQTCGKQFTLPENLVRHQRIHTGIRPYKCHLCSKSFTQSNELKSHQITHSSEKHHLCSVCGNKYSRSISLRVHMRRIHSIPPNQRPYICAVCGRNFKDRRDLSQHMLIHTGERSHVCKVCNKAFNRSSNLRVHERIHSGHKPHVCTVCQRAFIQKHVLITHLRTHPKST